MLVHVFAYLNKQCHISNFPTIKTWTCVMWFVLHIYIPLVNGKKNNFKLQGRNSILSPEKGLCEHVDTTYHFNALRYCTVHISILVYRDGQDGGQSSTQVWHCPESTTRCRVIKMEANSSCSLRVLHYITWDFL